MKVNAVYQVIDDDGNVFVQCNIKENAESIARILEADVEKDWWLQNGIYMDSSKIPAIENLVINGDICVGDEVVTNSFPYTKIIVTSYNKNWIQGFDKYMVFTKIHRERVSKTGKHYDIDNSLDEMEFKK